MKAIAERDEKINSLKYAESKEIRTSNWHPAANDHHEYLGRAMV